MVLETEELLAETGLVYTNDSQPGITRLKTQAGFAYSDSRGNPVTHPKTLERIKKLAIPPAWENVWIASKANAHLQATGIDQAGRKQYRYHQEWSRSRNENKYFNLLE
ncbi:MAG TPA: DNA topoisomerase IB, partial [Sphingobacteriaceae bacterium]